MDSLLVNGATYWLPKNTQEVIRLVDDAHKAGEVVCLRGSAHSFPIIGELEQGSEKGTSYRYIMLSRMNAVKFKGTTVTVEAGCHLGIDPGDPTGISTLENGLLYQLDKRGMALPDLGGITHQSVGGFLSTGSSGGSTKYSFESALESVEIVTCENGKATLKTFKRPAGKKPNPDDPFFAVGVAGLGLFGIIVSATFRAIPKFYIAGQEAITMFDDCEIDLLGNGKKSRKPSLQNFFQPKGLKPSPEYSRIIWWPQAGVTRTVVWKAWRSSLANAKKWAYPKESNPSGKPLKPYQEVPWIGGSPLLGNIGACTLYTALARWPDWLVDSLGGKQGSDVVKMVDEVFHPMLFPQLIGLFVQPDGAEGPQRFCDVGYTGLPMDNQMYDQLFPVWFTELWIPIDKTQAVMNALKKFYDADPSNPGNFCCEIYASAKNPFWMSPSYNTDVVRVDIFWFAYNKGNPRDFYKKFWNLLAPFNFRPHWGKFLPDANGAQGIRYLKKNYPKWKAWMDLREKLDPDQVFVNDYWRQHLGIAPVKVSKTKKRSRRS